MNAYGWRPQRLDPRDYSYTATAGRLPGKVDPLTKGIAPYDQLQLGSCVGNGTARVLEYEQVKQGEPSVTPSRLFIYGGARAYEGTYSSDSGSEIRDGIKTVAKLGAPPETSWPYSDADPGAFNAPIPTSVYTEAKLHEAIQYQAVTAGRGAPFRSAIAAGLPIVFGFNVPQFFQDGTWNPATEVLRLPGPNDQFVGGHCVVADGYDFTCTDFPEPFWWCANSWNATWGDAGWFRMDHRYFTSVASDFWVIQRTT